MVKSEMKNGYLMVYGDFVEDIEKDNGLLKYENCEIIDIDNEYIAFEIDKNSKIYLNNSIGEIEQVIY